MSQTLYCHLHGQHMAGVQRPRQGQVLVVQARDQLADPNFFATMMVASGDADGMVSGACHSTAATIRPGLQVSKPLPHCPWLLLKLETWQLLALYDTFRHVALVITTSLQADVCTLGPNAPLELEHAYQSKAMCKERKARCAGAANAGVPSGFLGVLHVLA